MYRLFVESVVALCMIVVAVILVLPMAVACVAVGLAVGVVALVCFAVKRRWNKVWGGRVQPQRHPPQPHRHSVSGSWQPHHMVHNK